MVVIAILLGMNKLSREQLARHWYLRSDVENIVWFLFKA